MAKLTKLQQETLNEITERLNAFSPDDHGCWLIEGTRYVSSMGFNGAVLKSLAKKGLIVQSTHRFFNSYWKLA